MLKHCHNSSIRLQRRCKNGHHLSPDTVSLNSTVTLQSIQSSCGSSESNTSDLNNSFNMNNNCQSDSGNCQIKEQYFYNERVPYSCTPDLAGPGSVLSSRASSYTSLVPPGDQEARTTIKVYASCLRSDIEYKTLSVVNSTLAKSVICQLLAKYRMKHRDPKLFFLTLEVVIQKPGRDGLTKKTLVLDEDSKPAELKNCNPWGAECRFTLQMKKGGLVRVHDSILMEESQYKCLLISEDTSVEDVIHLLLRCYGLEKVETVDRFCLYEQSSAQRYQRKLHSDDRPLQIQALWPGFNKGSGQTSFSFVLRRSLLVSLGQEKKVTNTVKYNRESDSTQQQNNRPQMLYNSGVRIETSSNAWGQRQTRGGLLQVAGPHGEAREQRLVVITEQEHRNENKNLGSISSGVSSSWSPDSLRKSTSSGPSSPDIASSSGKMSPISESLPSPSTGSETTEVRLQICEETWPECDKDSEEQSEDQRSSGSSDMDTSLSSSDSPVPPTITSTPLNRLVSQPAMSFLYPSPDYATFPSTMAPSRPYFSTPTSFSSISLHTHKISVAPILPPKPASGAPIRSSSTTPCNATFHDYENYFYI